MRRFGTLAVVAVFLLQAFAVTSMPVMAISADDQMIIICTGTGMKTVPLSDFGLEIDQDKKIPGTTPSGDICVLCPLVHGAAIAPSMVFNPAIDVSAHAPHAPPVDRLVSNGFRSVQQARAPPTSSD